MPEPHFLILIFNEILAQMFSCEFCKILWSSLFAEHSQATFSESVPLGDSVVRRCYNNFIFKRNQLPFFIDKYPVIPFSKRRFEQIMCSLLQVR